MEAHTPLTLEISLSVIHEVSSFLLPSVISQNKNPSEHTGTFLYPLTNYMGMGQRGKKPA